MYTTRCFMLVLARKHHPGLQCILVAWVPKPSPLGFRPPIFQSDGSPRIHRVFCSCSRVRGALHTLDFRRTEPLVAGGAGLGLGTAASLRAEVTDLPQMVALSRPRGPRAPAQ